jgi:hypothetical protein
MAHERSQREARLHPFNLRQARRFRRHPYGTPAWLGSTGAAARLGALRPPARPGSLGTDLRGQSNSRSDCTLQKHDAYQ